MLGSLVKIGARAIAITRNATRRGAHILAICIEHFHQLIAAGGAEQVNSAAIIVPRMHLYWRGSLWQLLNRIDLLLDAGGNYNLILFALSKNDEKKAYEQDQSHA